MTFLIVSVICVVVAALCVTVAWRLDKTPNRRSWHALWPEVFSGEPSVFAAWLALGMGRRPTSRPTSIPLESRDRGRGRHPRTRLPERP